MSATRRTRPRAEVTAAEAEQVDADRAIKTQLVLLTVLAVIAVVVLGWWLPADNSLSARRYVSLMLELLNPGLYRTANVTYRGITGRSPASNQPSGAREQTREHRQWLPDPHRRLGHRALSVGGQHEFVDLVSTCNSGPY